MRFESIAASYWRLIKKGIRTYESVPSVIRDIVKTLAKADVKDGVISAEDYANYIGEEYAE